MVISVAQANAQFQAAAGGTITHTINTPATSWATGDQALILMAFHDNQIADRTIQTFTATPGTMGSPTLSQPAQYTGASYRMGCGAGFAVFSAGNAAAVLTGTDNGDGSDMWLTAAVLKLTGADPATPFRQAPIVAGQPSGGSATVTATLGSAPASDSLLVASCIANGNSAWTVPSGWTGTALAETGWGGYHATMWKNGSNTQANSFTNAGAIGLAVTVFEIKAAATGATPGIKIWDGTAWQPVADPRSSVRVWNGSAWA